MEVKEENMETIWRFFSGEFHDDAQGGYYSEQESVVDMLKDDNQLAFLKIDFSFRSTILMIWDKT